MAPDGIANLRDDRSTISAGFLVFASTLLLSIAGYVYNAIASRHLGLSDYGALYSLISLYTIAILPSALAGPVIAKYAAEFAAVHDVAHQRGLVEFAMRAFGVIALIYVVIAWLSAHALASFLHVSAANVLVVGVMAGICLISGAIRSVAQGVHAYGSYSISVCAEALGRAGIIAVVSIAGLSVLGGLWSFAGGLSLGAVAIAALVFARFRTVRIVPVRFDWRRIAQTSVAASSIAVAISLMGFADVVIVQHFFASSDSGIYSAASLCAKIMMYFVSFVPAVLIPQAASKSMRGERTRSTFWLAFGFVCVVAFVGMLGYWALAPLILHAVVGRGFDGSIPLLVPYAGAMALLAMTNTLGSYALATHRLRFVWPLFVATIVTIAAIWFYHPTLPFVVEELLVGNLVMGAVTAISLITQPAARREA